MRGWVKHLFNGETLVGEDRNVYGGKVSWSRTPTDIVGADFYHDRYLISIRGIGSYHQSDDFVTKYGDSDSVLIARRLQRLITPEDSFAVLQAMRHGLVATVGHFQPCSIGPLPGTIRQEVIPLGGHNRKWLTVELTVKTGQIKAYIEENRI